MGRRVLKFDGPLARGLWIAALRCTANTFCRSVSDAQNVVSRFPFRGNEFIMPPVGGKTVKPRLRHRSGDLLESPFMCRPGTNFARLGDPLQGLHMGNAPLLSPAATSPPEGEILAALYLELLMNSNAKRRENFPPRGGKGTGFVGERSNLRIQ